MMYISSPPDPDSWASKVTKLIGMSKTATLFVGLCALTPAVNADPSTLPLFQTQDMTYQGAFRIPSGNFGSSSVNFSRGAIAFNPSNNSLFISGHDNEGAVAEFSIPELVNSTNISDLNMSSSPVQSFERLTNKQSISYDLGVKINGLHYVDGELLVNVFEFYDNWPYQTKTTLAVRDAANLSGSQVSGYFEMGGAARAAGWMSDVPEEWQSSLGGDLISGFSGGNTRTTISRFSVGPSAFVINSSDVVGNPSPSSALNTTEVLGYSLANGLVSESNLTNDTRDNDLWTHMSEAAFGFIVPGTRTYAVFGFSGGHNNGITYGDPPYGGYKGYYTNEQYDISNYYWLYDVNDLVAVKNGSVSPYDVRPYDYGEFQAPFQSGRINQITGGTFDPATGTVYFTLYYADTQQGTGTNPPIVVAYNVAEGNGGSNSGGGTGSGGGNTETPPVDQTPPPPPAVALPPQNFTVTVGGSSSGGSSQGGSSSGESSDSGSSGSGSGSNQAAVTYNPAFGNGSPDPLPIPSSVNTFNVSNASELANAVSNLQDNSVILLAPGTYNLSSTLYIRRANVFIAGTGSAPGDVVLLGRGMENSNYGNVFHGIWTDAVGLTVTNLTIRDVYFNGIVFNGGAENPHVYNVDIIDTGSQFIKGNPVSYGDGVDNGIVEFVKMEYTSGPPLTDHGGGTGYTNGVDVHAGHNWIIRNNAFINFHTPDNVDHRTNPAILMWNGARNTVAEGNVFIDVDRAISFGLYDNPGGNDHSGGVIKNNMMYYRPGLYTSNRTQNSDAAIIVWDSPNTKVYHNTILTNGNLRRAIEFRFDTNGVEARNNLLDAVVTSRSGESFTAANNNQSATAGMFVNAAIGDLHLTSSVEKVGRLSDVSTDIDGQTRASSTDVGADEL